MDVTKGGYLASVDHEDPLKIDTHLGELIALLDEYGETRWSMAFDRVREHVSVTLGAQDLRSTARVVRDLLHMFRGGLGPFAGMKLRREDVVDVGATEQLSRTWNALREELARQLEADAR